MRAKLLYNSLAIILLLAIACQQEPDHLGEVQKLLEQNMVLEEEQNIYLISDLTCGMCFEKLEHYLATESDKMDHRLIYMTQSKKTRLQDTPFHSYLKAHQFIPVNDRQLKKAMHEFTANFKGPYLINIRNKNIRDIEVL